MKAVDGVSLDIRRGEVLGLVGESGSGKTTLGRTLLGLVRATAGQRPSRAATSRACASGEFRAAPPADAGRLPGSARVAEPGDDDRPGGRSSAADPRAREGRDEIRARVAAALEHVGLAPAEQYLDKYPSDLSGGQKQRAVIARAIILNPVLLVADEPVSMLDMSVRAKILELMLALKRDFDLTYLYITHDLATAKFFCDRIAIMYLGRIVEIGPSRGDLRRSEAPVHPGAAARDPGARSATRCPARPPARRGTGRRASRRSGARSTRGARAAFEPVRLGELATCGSCSSRAGRAPVTSASNSNARRSATFVLRPAVDVGAADSGEGRFRRSTRPGARRSA